MKSALEVNKDGYPQDINHRFPPIPYFPKLCRVLGGVTIAIVFTYLEIHHSPIERESDAKPAHAGLRMPPVALDCDQACDDLGVARRTLHTALESLGVWWRLESQRSVAARSGRDFLNIGRSFPASTHMLVRPYAIVGKKDWNAARTLVIHRNQMRVEQILVNAGIVADPNCGPLSTTSRSGHSVHTAPMILENVLGLEPQKRGLAWGWSQERVKEHSARMTRLWAERREKGLVGGSRRRR